MIKEDKKKRFCSPGSAWHPIYYFDMPHPNREDAEILLRAEIQKCLGCGCATIVPQLAPDAIESEDGIAAVGQLFALLLQEASAAGLQVGFHLCAATERAVLLGESEDSPLRTRVLGCREIVCDPNQLLERPLRRGDERLSLVGFCEESSEIIDLRAFVSSENKLFWQVPNGNFVVREYFCAPHTKTEGVNYLSYDASLAYIKRAFALFEGIFAPYLGTTLTHLTYSDICFNGPNRRSWDLSFNRVFEERFGYDPAPFYPALFGYIGPDTDHRKAHLMTVRASLLQNGMIRALSDFATERGLHLFGCISEPKIAACSFLTGDAMLCSANAPAALYEKAYMYGTNSVKIAAGTAYNFDVEQVGAELFRDYEDYDPRCLYKDAMNAFARGVNDTALHLPEELTRDSMFCDFVARVQTTLRGGRHIADIAMLYPIYDLHSKVNLYTLPEEEFEYPSTPSTTNYMTLINSISIYAGHDLTLLHPETLNTRCRTEGGVLYLDNKYNREQFRIVVMPSASMISLCNLRLLHRFFMEGGKILATGLLPTRAFEFDPKGEADREVRRLVAEIFGREACDPRVMRDFCHNKNGAGGEAILLYFNASAADGTKMTRAATVNEALNSFELPFDIYMPGMPRMQCTGGLNAPFPEFKSIGLHRTIPGGGMLNHIHKHFPDCDMYYFSNTTSEPYNHHVLLKGAFSVEEWDPHTGKITESKKKRFLSYKGEVYTNLRLTLPACASTFFCAEPVSVQDEELTPITSIARLQSEHAALMSEF